MDGLLIYLKKLVDTESERLDELIKVTVERHDMDKDAKKKLRQRADMLWDDYHRLESSRCSIIEFMVEKNWVKNKWIKKDH